MVMYTSAGMRMMVLRKRFESSMTHAVCYSLFYQVAVKAFRFRLAIDEDASDKSVKVIRVIDITTEI